MLTKGEERFLRALLPTLIVVGGATIVVQFIVFFTAVLGG